MTFLEKAQEWVCVKMRLSIEKNMDAIFTSLNEKTASIGSELSKTPQSWNSNIFSMIQNLSENVIVPIAGVILTLILCYEIISLITEKNNMHDIESFVFFKIILKMGIAVYLLSHTFEIAMAIFDLAQKVIESATGMITTKGEIVLDPTLIQNLEKITNVFELLQILVMTGIMRIIIHIIGLAIMIVLYGRFMEIYIYCSIAPIPFATFANKEWGQMGNNYVKGLMALAFQGFFMLICVAIYNALVQGLITSTDLVNSLLEMAAYSVLLVLGLFKTSSISKSIFNAH